MLSVINYCIKIWGTTSNHQKQRVQKLQNFAARVAVGVLRKYDHVSPAFEELKWLRVKQKHLFDTLPQVFMSVNHIYPSWYCYFPHVNQVTIGNTRQGSLDIRLTLQPGPPKSCLLRSGMIFLLRSQILILYTLLSLVLLDIF